MKAALYIKPRSLPSTFFGACKCRSGLQVKPSTKFSKIFDAYAGKKGVEAANIKFLHDGQRIRDHQTPGELGIEVGHARDVHKSSLVIVSTVAVSCVAACILTPKAHLTAFIVLQDNDVIDCLLEQVGGTFQ